MNKPHFTVVIPAYNAAKTIRSAICSVLKQSDQDFDIVVIDDGSTDDTVYAALELAETDDRIRVSSQKNQGVSAARNLGVALARGHLIAFLDADDRWAENKLAEHRALHDRDPAVEASFGRIAFRPDQDGAMGHAKTVSQVPETYLDIPDAVVENAVCTCSNLVVERDSFLEIGGFSRSMRYAEDQDFLARFIGDGRLVKGIQETLVDYRMSADGLSCDFDAMLQNWRDLAVRWSHRIDLAGAEALYCRYLARRALRSGARASVARSFVKRGLAAHSQIFLSGGRRSALTLGGVLAAPLMPANMRTALFA